MVARLFAYAFVAMLVSGCATSPFSKPPPSVGPIDQALVKYEELNKTGQTEKASALLADIKREHPTRKEPWLKQAQMSFDVGNYGQAIVDAQEALQRDPVDRIAQGIVAVSGLRVSANALADMVRRDGVPGTVRDEAAVIAKSLRESLGESVLVPPPPAPVVVTPAPAPPSVTTKPKAQRTRPARHTPAPTPAPAAEKNPFDALK